MIHRRLLGFTLLEMLIYTFLLGLMVSGTVFLTRTVFDLRMRSRSVLVLEENLRFALLRITGRIHNADTVLTPMTNGTSGSSLVLDLSDLGENPTSFRLVNGAIQMTRDGNPELPLTSNEVEVTSLTFTRLQGTPTEIRIQIAGRLRVGTTSTQRILTLTDTASLRR